MIRSWLSCCPINEVDLPLSANGSTIILKSSTTLNGLIHSTLQCMERRRMQMFHLTSRTIQTVPLGTFRLSIHYCQGMQSINQSIIQSIKQSINQSTNQPINQSIHQY